MLGANSAALRRRLNESVLRRMQSSRFTITLPSTTQVSDARTTAMRRSRMVRSKPKWMHNNKVEGIAFYNVDVLPAMKATVLALLRATMNPREIGNVPQGTVRKNNNNFSSVQDAGYERHWSVTALGKGIS